MSTITQKKKLNNRFDQWEVLSIFTQTTGDYLKGLYSTYDVKFYIKCVLGVLMAINAYLSHFGPWTWPGNYNFLIFSVIFFFIASNIYSKLGGIQAGEGNNVGQFIVDGSKKIYLFKLTDGKIEYILEQVESQTKEVLRKKSFTYLEYFTQDGEFLSQRYLKHLQGFMNNKKK